jgi:hypothetical protein
MQEGIEVAAGPLPLQSAAMKYIVKTVPKHAEININVPHCWCQSIGQKKEKMTKNPVNKSIM